MIYHAKSHHKNPHPQPLYRIVWLVGEPDDTHQKAIMLRRISDVFSGTNNTREKSLYTAKNVIGTS